MSFPRYPKYKDSGVEWLGEVPEHWRLRRLKEIAHVSGGGTPSREVPEYWRGDIPWVSPKDMKAEEINGAEESITALGLSESTSSLHPPGRVLIVIRSGILQRVIPVAINAVAVSINQDLKALAFTLDACVPSFFLRWVQGLNDSLLLAWAQQGATVESINQSLFLNTTIPLPSLPEQTRIAAFLDRETAKIDALIAEQQRLIELLQEKRQAVISHAVTKGLNPDAPMKDSGIAWLGRIPRHWGVVHSRRLFALRNERARAGDQQLTASQEHGVIYQEDFIRLEGRRVVEVIKGSDILKHVEPQDFVISMRSFQGGIEWCRLRGSISSAYVMLIPRADLHCPFFAHLFKSRSYIQALQSTSNLVRDGQALRYANFTLVALPDVPQEEQVAVAAYLDAETTKMDSLVAEAERAITLLQERRSALISAAVTGQIDVRGLAGSEAA
jgi:type I restriction enzyme S subunit